jgi:hypothetical protein
MHKHYVCPCNGYIFLEQNTAVTRCPNCEHPREIDKKKQGQYFYYFPISATLQLFWSQWRDWAEACYYPWDEYESGSFTDLYDFQNWKKHEQLVNPGNMGLSFNADGVSMFKSEKYSLWPLLLQFANLPPKLRYGSFYIFFFVIEERRALMVTVGDRCDTCMSLLLFLQS